MKVMHRLAMASRQPHMLNMSIDSYPCQLHPKYGMGRFVWDISARGTVGGLGPTIKDGMSVWDFDTQNNKWRLSRFAPRSEDYHSSDWARWSWTRSGVYALASDDIILGIDGSSDGSDSQTKECWRALAGVDAKPRFGMSYGDIEYAGEENTESIEFYSRPCVAFDGKLIFGYYSGWYGETEQTYNGFINTVTETSFSAMSGALRTDLVIGQYSGQPGLGLSFLGGENPNGYIVANAPGNDLHTTSTFALVNCNATPFVVSRVSWPGYQVSIKGVCPISATRMVVADRLDSSYNGRLNLIYANSATAPSQLTRGAYVTMPDPPDGCGYASVDVDFSACNVMGCSNYWVKDGAFLVLVYWKMHNEKYIYAPCIVRSTSNTNLTIEHATQDVNGDSPTLYDGDDYGNYRLTTVGAPGGKATVLAVNNNGILTQQTFQL